MILIDKSHNLKIQHFYSKVFVHRFQHLCIFPYLPKILRNYKAYKNSIHKALTISYINFQHFLQISRIENRHRQNYYIDYNHEDPYFIESFHELA